MDIGSSNPTLHASDDFMESIVSDLVTQYERGRLSRRQLVQSLTALAASGFRAEAADTRLKIAGVDHLSIYVSDLERSAQFYERLGFTRQAGQSGRVSLTLDGKTRIALSANQPAGSVDHFGLSVTGFNADSAKSALRALDMTPEEGDGAGFHVKDPDGVRIQLL
jgi:catechol 2,3-dioxygenase-like lactoylglutathione lyase family enzyme